MINYKIDVINSLIKVETFVKGRLLNVSYLNNNNEEVINIEIVYVDDVMNVDFPLSRITTRRWIDNDGLNRDELFYDKTVSIKKYDQRQTIDEMIKRRGNIITHVFSTASQMGYLTNATNYIANHSNLMDAYKLTGATDIIDVINNDTDEWLENDAVGVVPVLTMRQLITSALTIV
jgi:hypothetical protein